MGRQPIGVRPLVTRDGLGQDCRVKLGVSVRTVGETGGFDRIEARGDKRETSGRTAKGG